MILMLFSSIFNYYMGAELERLYYDEKRQKLLVDNLKDVQMFITTAEYLHKNVLDMNNTTVFYIDNGKVVKTENGGN